MGVTDNLKMLGKKVAEIAPALGKVLPFPGGEILGNVIAAALGGDVSDPAALAAKISASSEAQAKLLEIQKQYEVEIQKIELQYYVEALKDKDSARSREVEIAKTGSRDNTPRNLAYFTVAGFLLVLFLVPFLPIQGPEKQIMLVLVGMLASKFGSVIDYYFGSAASRETVKIES